MNKTGSLVIISGFSGAGKGTVVKELLRTYENYALSVSATTRSPRPGEVDGREYFFKSQEEFQEMIRQDAFYEYARYVSNYYGTPKAYVQQQLKKGKDVILEIEVQGALAVKKKNPEAILIFLSPPGAEELERRLISRGTESREVIRDRMKRAAEESLLMTQYDYLIINDDLEQCTREIHELVERERFRMKANTDFVERIQTELNGICQ